MGVGSIKRSFTLSLDPELAQALINFMVSENFSSQNEACRALIRMALSSTPVDGAIEAAKQRAYNEIRGWAVRELAKFYQQQQQFLRQTAKSIEEIPHS